MNGRIALEGLEFHAHHGVYPHERESGNFFEIDIAVETDFSQAAAHDDLRGTVNYEVLFKIVKDEMEQPSKLLETVAEKIVTDVMETLPAVMSVDLRISKLNPPIGVKCKKATINLTKRRHG
jgi:7,8-dihydroneopterin aldolase/epimerase/oxygenase